MGAKQLLKSTPLSKLHICCPEKKTASNHCLRSFSWHSPCSDLHCIFWLLPTCREHARFPLGPVSTSRHSACPSLFRHTLPCGVDEWSFLILYKFSWSVECPLFGTHPIRSYCFGSVIGYSRRTQLLWEYRLFDPNSPPRTHSKYSVRSHRMKGLLGCCRSVQL